MKIKYLNLHTSEKQNTFTWSSISIQSFLKICQNKHFIFVAKRSKVHFDFKLFSFT